MTNQEFQDKLNLMQEKIGKDSSALILDDIASLITDNQAMNKALDDSKKENDSLKKRNEHLIDVNGSLLQQVAMSEEEPKINNKIKEEEKKKEPFDFRSAFDEYGNFKN